jgi:hypothetical protein
MTDAEAKRYFIKVAIVLALLLLLGAGAQWLFKF